MPLVAVHKAMRRKRPVWQDTRPPEEELRATYDIAARHAARWSRAYMAATRELLTPEILRELRRHVQDGDIDAAVKIIPQYKKTDTVDAWASFQDKIKRAYAGVVTEAGEAEFQREKIPLTFGIAKQVERVPVVPISPWSVKWIEKESARLVRRVSAEVRQNVRQIIKRGYERGLRTDAMLDQIKSEVGLLPKESAAVTRRLDLLTKQGFSRERALAAADRYAAQLHTKRASRIARAETITAQARGRRDSWRMAIKEKALPEDVEREWLAVVISPRTCEICEGLDGQRVPVGEPYYSDVLGMQVDGPGMPAHPQCRCGERLHRGPRK